MVHLPSCPTRRARAGQPGMIGMHGGLPPDSVFPFTSLSFTTVDPFAAATDSAPAPPAAPLAADPAAGDGTAISAPATLAAMQQYNMEHGGDAPLCAWLRELTVKMQDPARSDVAVSMTSGTTLSIETAFRMLLDPGDEVLVEAYMYSQVCPPHAVHARREVARCASPSALSLPVLTTTVATEAISCVGLDPLPSVSAQSSCSASGRPPV